jgi:hypothetical protein
MPANINPRQSTSRMEVSTMRQFAFIVVAVAYVLCTSEPVRARQPTDEVVVSVGGTRPSSPSVLATVAPVVTAFVLTTVLGGLLGYHLQTRSWRFQRQETLRELHQSEATKIFDEVSRLLDSRLYRMRHVMWALKRQPSDLHYVERQWRRYRPILYRWNDSVNRNRALIHRYFGKNASVTFERGIGDRLVIFHEEMRQYYVKKRFPDAGEVERLEQIAAEVNDIIWHFDDELVDQVKCGRVGAFL